MIVISYGDEYSSGSHIVQPYTWAYEDIFEKSHGARPHPANLTYAFGFKTALLLHAGFMCGVAEKSSFLQIRNSYQEIANKNKDLIPIISWSDENLQFIDEIEAWGAELPVAAFINSKKTFKSKCDKWIWNTSQYSIDIWAHHNNGFIPNTNYLSAQANHDLSNLVLLHLTELMKLATLD